MWEKTLSKKTRNYKSKPQKQCSQKCYEKHFDYNQKEKKQNQKRKRKEITLN